MSARSFPSGLSTAIHTGNVRVSGAQLQSKECDLADECFLGITEGANAGFLLQLYLAYVFLINLRDDDDLRQIHDVKQFRVRLDRIPQADAAVVDDAADRRGYFSTVGGGSPSWRDWMVASF